MNLTPTGTANTFEAIRAALKAGRVFMVDDVTSPLHQRVIDIHDMLAMGVDRVKVFFEGGKRIAVIDITMLEE